MKRVLTLIAAATLSVSAWADTLPVGASTVPHAAI
ncbi:methionine ABC transporter substrate-binding protein, partial [Cronobacter sakazakii]